MLLLLVKLLVAVARAQERERTQAAYGGFLRHVDYSSIVSYVSPLVYNAHFLLLCVVGKTNLATCVLYNHVDIEDGNTRNSPPSTPEKTTNTKMMSVRATANARTI